MPDRKTAQLGYTGMLFCALGALLAGPKPVLAVPMACRYEVTVIPDPPQLLCGGSPVSTQAKAINANGDVAGDAYCSAVAQRPFLWTPEGGFQIPPAPPGSPDSPVAAMNNSREIVGTGQFPQFRGYLRQANGQYVILPIGPNGTEGWANGVNDASIVVGYWGNGVTGPNPLPCKWINGQLTTLTDLVGAPRGQARAINLQGKISGWRGTTEFTDGLAFILDGDRATILPPIPGGNTSEGHAINELGDVAGMGWFVPPIRHAYLWMDGRAYDLGVLPGTDRSDALDINNHRIVVGWASSRAWVWQDGAMRDLNDLIPTQSNLHLNSAYSINDEGQIAVWGSLGSISGPSRAVLLTPVYPVPADLSADCAVNTIDLGILLSSWSIPSAAPGCHGAKTCPADLNADGFVNSLDLGVLLVNWSIQ